MSKLVLDLPQLLFYLRFCILTLVIFSYLSTELIFLLAGVTDVG